MKLEEFMPLFEPPPSPPPDGMCQWHCGKRATHFCYGCGKWICDGVMCNLKSAANTFGFRFREEN